MTEKDFNSVLRDVEKVVNGFKAEDWKERKLFVRFKELFNMVDGYDLPLDQKIYVLKKGILILAAEAIHDVFPATDYFRENSAERFLVFRTPGQEINEKYINDWNITQKGNWARQGEAGGEEAANVRLWWN